MAGNTTSYTYNGLEQRVSKTGPLVPTGAAYYAYDSDGKTLGEYDANLYPVAETVYLGTTPVAVLKLTGSAASSTLQINVGNVYADQIDTPRVISRNSDEAIETVLSATITNNPFGKKQKRSILHQIGGRVTGASLRARKTRAAAGCPWSRIPGRRNYPAPRPVRPRWSPRWPRR